MEKKQKKAFVHRDEEGNILLDTNECITCISEDGMELKIEAKNIDFSKDCFKCVVNNEEIIINVWESAKNEGVDKDAIPSSPMNAVPEEGSMTIKKEIPFSWTDKFKKLFLTLYKDIRDLLQARKIKNLKSMWKEISTRMNKAGYATSPLQVENKFKTMERACKNVISNNNKTGRGRATCSYESELTELLGHKYNIIPLATSGRTGLTVRGDAEDSSSVVPSVLNVSLQRGATSNVGTSDVHNSKVMVSTNYCQDKTATGNTAKSLVLCQKAIDSFTAEIYEQRNKTEKWHSDVIEKQNTLIKMHEEFFKTVVEQREAANRQREERNQLLKTIVLKQQNASKEKEVNVIRKNIL